MRPVSIPQIWPPNIHRSGAAKNRRAPADPLEKTPTVGSAAVLGRINVTTNPTTRFDHANAAPEHSPAGMPKQRACLHTAPFALAADPDGFPRAAADAVSGGRREAFGVRQLAAA